MPINNPSITGLVFRLGWAVPDLDKTAATAHDVVGRKDNRVVAGAVNPSPTTQSHVDANSAQILSQVTTFNVAGTLRLTGTSYDPDTQTTTPADTEDIVVAATGFFLSTKHWRGTIVLSSVGGLDVVLSTFFVVPHLIGRDYTLDKLLAEYKSSGASNTSTITLQKFSTAAGYVTVFTETFLNITSMSQAKHIATSLAIAINESAGDYIYMFITAQRLIDYHFEIGGS